MRYPRMTEQEFFDWCDADTFAEWVDGKVIDVSRTNLTHATLSSFLMHLVYGFVESHDLGTVLRMPVQVRLAKQKCRRTPDLLFVSKRRERIIAEYEIDGPPDLICEIVSKESKKRDYNDKFRDYESAGVREYWIIDPLCNTFSAYHLEKPANQYASLEPVRGRVNSIALPGFYLRSSWLFTEKHPKALGLLKEMSSKR